MLYAWADPSFWRGRLLSLPHYGVRFLRNPVRECRRIWYYGNRPRRDAFLTFQADYVNKMVPMVKSLTPVGPGTDSQDGALSWAYGCQAIPVPEVSLRDALLCYGSDKASIHDYDVIYGNFAAVRGRPGVVLEIGLGTSASLPSSMGPLARPGASVRAFRDWGAFVVGCDIDKKTLFSEPGIVTLQVDQLSTVPFRQLEGTLRSLGGIDLAIVDGLHTLEADLNSFVTLAPWLSPTGLLVVEDIEEDPIVRELWADILGAIPASFHAELLQTRAAGALVMGRTPFWTSERLRSLYQTHGDIG